MTDAELSVVVQGPADDRLAGTVASVRRVLPRAQLVVSTWEGADVGGLDADDVVLSPDPGTVGYRTVGGERDAKVQNANRMVTSTRAGLARAERPWAVKLRNDTPLVHDGFLDWLGAFPARHPCLRVLGSRVLTSSLFTTAAAGLPACLFHPSDCVHVGATADLVELWSAPPVDEEANVAWRARHPDPDPRHRWGPVWWPRYFNEQLVWLSCLRRNGHDVGYDHNGHVSAELVERSELSIANNFVVLEPWQLGVAFPRFRDGVRRSDLRGVLWFEGWRALYRRFCDPAATGGAGGMGGAGGQDRGGPADTNARRTDRSAAA